MLGRVGISVAVLLSLLYLLIGVNLGLRPYGDGLSLYGALRVLDGHVPYRDFLSISTPGEFYLLAGLFKILGPSILIARVFSTLINLALAVAVLLILRRLVRPGLALAGFIFAVLWIGSFRFTTYPMFPALLLILLSAHFVVRYFSGRRRVDLFWAGILLGLAVLFRHDLGAYAFIAEVPVVAFFTMTIARSRPPDPRRWKLAVAAAKGWILLGVAVVLIPPAAYFLSRVSFGDLFYDLVTFPLTVYSGARGLPYPPPRPDTIPFYFPILVLAVSVAVLVRSTLRRTIQWDRPRVWTQILFTVLGILFLNQARVRSDMPHLLPVLLSSVIPFLLLADEGLSQWRTTAAAGRGRPRKIALILWLATGVLCLAHPAAQKWMRVRMYWDGSPTYTLEIPRARGVLVPEATKNYEEMVHYVQSVVPEGERIYVGLTRHDRATLFDPLLYFLTDRHSATRFHEIHPGLTTTEEIQRRMAEEIEAAGVRRIVLASPYYEDEGGDPMEGSTRLDEYIKENFRPVRLFRGYKVLKKK